MVKLRAFYTQAIADANAAQYSLLEVTPVKALKFVKSVYVIQFSHYKCQLF